MNTAGPAFSPTLTSLIDSVGATSSSTIVPTPTAVPSTAPTGLVSVAVNVSLPSYSASPTVGTDTVCVVTPGANVTVAVVAA